MPDGIVGYAGGASRLLRRVSSLFVPLLLLCAGTAPALAQSAPATFIEPADGSEHDPTRPIRWTAQPEALAYYLYIGTAPGLKDVVNSGETQATQWSAVTLPRGVTLYARIYTKYSTGWVSSSVSFSARPVAVFTSPSKDGATLSPNARFQWTSVQNTQAYYLTVGSAPGSHDYVNTGEIQSTSYDAIGLPAGKTVYARLHTLHGGTWRSVDLILNVLPLATFIAPLNGDQEFDPAAEITWRPVLGAQAYYLYVGTAPGRKDLIDSRETQLTHWPATYIPAGQPVYATLYTKYDGVWRSSALSFRLSPKAVFIEPEKDGLDLDPRASLMWTDVSTAQSYYLYIGTSPGAKDAYDSGEVSALSFDLEGLPRGRVLYATLYTRAGNVWRYTRRSFRILPVATLLPRPDTPGRIDTRIPIQWTSVEGAEAYYLYVGSTPGAKDLINTGAIQTLQRAIDSLPAGRLVYVRLFTKHDGVWRFVESTWTTRAVAYLDGAVASSATWSSATPLTWAPFAGASRYFVYVGSKPGATDLSSSGEISGTTFVMPAHHAAAIPSDQTVYVRLYSLVDGHWEFVDYSLWFKVEARLTFPLADATNVGVSALRFTWNEIADATAYRLQLGTSPGSSDLLDSAELTVLEERTGALPGAQTLFARLWTEVDGEWRYSDSSFMTRPASAFVHPRHGELNADLTLPVEWTSVPGADQYRVEIGSTPGSHDLLDTGLTTDSSVASTPALASASGIVYARVWTHNAGAWLFSDAIFTASSDPQFAEMTWLTSADTFRAGDAFRWTESPMANWYRLRLGTTPTGDDLHDSGPIRTVRRLVDDLPANTLLYGSLETSLIDGTVSVEQFEFTVVDAAVQYDDRWNLALWATAEIRGMAINGNVPLPNTLLRDTARIQLRESAYCTTYATALQELTRQINLGLDVRILNVCLNENAFDCHTLVEVLNPLEDRWQILDPTFGLAAQRVADGKWATSTDIFESTRDANFAAIEYVPLTSQGLSYAQAYYLDYPLLFAHVLAPGSGVLISQVESVLPYYLFTGTDVVAEPGYFAIRCLGNESSILISVEGADGALTVDSDGVAVVSCDVGQEGLSHVFRATQIAPVDGGGDFEIAVPNRFVFN